MILAPTTTLDAVNEILSALGDAPVNSLENSRNINVVNAVRMLTINNRYVQAKGWDCNTAELTLTPGIKDQRIPYLGVYLTLQGPSSGLYNQEGYVYDPLRGTSIFTGPVQVTAVLLLPFETLPECLRHYITAKTASAFQIRYLGDPSLAQELAQDEAKAWAAVMEWELTTGQYSALSNSAVQELLRRS